MTRRMLAAAVALAALSPAQADVTLKATAEGRGLGMSGSTSNLTYIKGLKMRSEATSGKASNVTIFDVDAQKMYILNDKKKQAEVWDMAAFAQQIGQSVVDENVRASMTANGQTKTVNGQAADGYDIEMIERLAPRLSVPLIVSGGCGSLQHAIDALEAGASAVAISSMFLFTDHSPIKLRSHLASRGLNVRASSSSRN